MPTVCPVCGQPVQKLDSEELQKRVKDLATPLISHEKELLEQTFKKRVEAEARKAELIAEKRLRSEYQEKLVHERNAGLSEGKKLFSAKVAEAEKKANDAERKFNERLETARFDIKQKLEKQNTAAVQQAVRDAEKRFEKSEAEKEKERLRFEAEKIRLQDQLDKLSRKLDSQSGEELGEEGERDLAILLKQTFQGDRIERIGRGVKGADIVHHVLDGTKLCGRIIYESKNVSNWNNSFVTQAKKYQTQYETPHVVIVSNVFPHKHKSMCICEGVPVVSLRTAIPLATIIRDGILEISQLKVSDVARDEKSKELFDYIVSDKFGTRFKEVAEAINNLRDQQLKERTWHENTWESRTKLHDRLDSRHREIAAQIRSITNREARVIQLAAKA
jgi:hypothetical protein